MNRSCVYKIINVIDNKFYVGSAVNIDKRIKKHVYELENNAHVNSRLQYAWDKFGKENFVFEIVEEVLDKSKLVEREQYYLDALNPTYNICKIAGSCLGVKRSEETKSKISKAKKGKALSSKHKQNISIFMRSENNPHIGKKNPNAIEAMKEARKGKFHSEETRKKMSLSHLGIKRPDLSIRMKGENNHMYGKKHSDETIKKMRESKMGDLNPMRKKLKEKVRTCVTK